MIQSGRLNLAERYDFASVLVPRLEEVRRRSCDHGRGAGAAAAEDGTPAHGPSRAFDHRGEIDEALVASAIPELVARWRAERSRRDGRDPALGQTLRQERIARFVEALLGDDVEGCEACVASAFAGAGDPQQVSEDLFDPAMRIIGERWVSDESTFLEATMAFCRVQRMFRHLSSEHPPEAAGDGERRLLLSPAPGDQHGFGLSVVDDAFRRAGWEVDCCACDEGADLFRLAASRDYAVIGISLSVGRLQPDLSAFVSRLRARSCNRSVALMAGGNLVVQMPHLAIDAGFDLVAADVASGVRLAEDLIASRRGRGDLRMAAE